MRILVMTFIFSFYTFSDQIINQVWHDEKLDIFFFIFKYFLGCNLKQIFFFILHRYFYLLTL